MNFFWSRFFRSGDSLQFGTSVHFSICVRTSNILANQIASEDPLYSNNDSFSLPSNLRHFKVTNHQESSKREYSIRPFKVDSSHSWSHSDLRRPRCRDPELNRSPILYVNNVWCRIDSAPDRWISVIFLKTGNLTFTWTNVFVELHGPNRSLNRGHFGGSKWYRMVETWS